VRCAEALKKIDRMALGEPNPPGSDLAEHLVSCSGCAREFRRQAALLDLLGHSDPPRETPDLAPAVLRRLPPRRTFLDSHRWAAAAALALAALGLGYFLGRAWAPAEPPSAPSTAMMAAYGQALTDEPFESLERVYSGLRPGVQTASDKRSGP